MILKPVYNEEFRMFDFSPQLTDGETLSAVEVKIITSQGEDLSATMISDVAPYNGTSVRYKIKGGVSGQTYNRVFRVTTSNGQKLEDEALIRVA